MIRRLFVLPMALALFSAWAVGTARAGDFIDTRLSFVLSENNFFAGPGETQVNSPGLGFGADKSNTQFYDNYETKFSGFETLGTLTLYKRMPSFFPHLDTEAALVMRVSDTSLYDAGSYIRLIYDLGAKSGKKRDLELVMFPVSGDRFRLGYSYKISWGGNGIFPAAGYVPAAKLQLNLPWGYSFLGVKTAQILEYIGNTEQTEMVTNYGALGGMGMDVRGIRAEFNGGFFTRGTFDYPGVTGEKMYGGGLSYQIGYHSGMDIGTSIDFALYKNDPMREVRFFKPETYDGGVSIVAKHEGDFLFQTLIDPENWGTTVNQQARAFDFNLALKAGFVRAHLDIMYRTLSYVLYEVPSFTPYQEFPDAAVTRPERFIALGADYHFPSLHLTPGFTFGIQDPATYSIENVDIGSETFLGQRTVVVLDSATRSVLPVDETASLIYSFKLTAKWDLSEMLAMVGEVYYSRDANQVWYVSLIDGMNVFSYSEFIDPRILGMNVAFQARF